MRVNDYNASILVRIRAAIGAFNAGHSEIEDVQVVLQQSLGLFENDGSDVYDLVDLAENDLEGIRFTMLADEQRPAALFRLDALLDALPAVAV